MSRAEHRQLPKSREMHAATPPHAQPLARRVTTADVQAHPLWIDGFNVLPTVEVALGGGVVLAARDRTYRDIDSVIFGRCQHWFDRLPQVIASVPAARHSDDR